MQRAPDDEGSMGEIIFHPVAETLPSSSSVSGTVPVDSDPCTFGIGAAWRDPDITDKNWGVEFLCPHEDPSQDSYIYIYIYICIHCINL